MFVNSISNLIVSVVFSSYIRQYKQYIFFIRTATHSNFDEMHKIFIGGYTDSAHSTILDGFNGIIGGKTRKDTAAQFHISDGFLRHSHEINVRAESFRISNKCFCLLATYVQNLSVFVINVFSCLFFFTQAPTGISTASLT